MSSKIVKFRCSDHVHAWVVDDRYIRIRCTGRRCKDAVLAKQRGERAIHVFDIITRKQTTEFVPISKEADHGSHV